MDNLLKTYKIPLMHWVWWFSNLQWTFHGIWSKWGWFQAWKSKLFKSRNQVLQI